MYLFLVDSGYIFSKKLQNTIDQMLPQEDFIYCYSTATFLKLTEKENPEYVIIDMDLIGDNKVDLLKNLYEKSPETYVLTLTGPDLYEYLYEVIDAGLVDDYIVKPVSEDELIARILIANHIKRADIIKPDATDLADHKINENDLFNPPLLDEYLLGSHDENVKNTSYETIYINENEEMVDFKNLGEEAEVLKDDEELFGMVGRESSVDYSSFEELFGMTAERDQKKKGIVSEPKKKATKQGKAEYLPFTKEIASVKTESFPVNTEKDKTVVNKKALKKNFRKLNAAKPKPTAREVNQKQSNSKFLRVTGNLVTALLLLVMVTLSFFLIQSRISGGSPAVAGYQMYVVLSGSMKPAFDTGSLVFVKPAEPLSITEGDIITFSSSGDTTRLTTHRVAGINYEGGLSFVTRGDANNVNDPNPVAAENVIGRVTGSVPYLGYIYGFAQTRQGLIILFFVPGLLLIIKELRRLFKYIFESRAEQLKSGTLKETDDLDPARTDPENSKPVIPKGDLTGSLKDFGF